MALKGDRSNRKKRLGEANKKLDVEDYKQEQTDFSDIRRASEFLDMFDR